MYETLYLLVCVFQVGIKKNMGKIKAWTDNIYNHFWYCCSECNGDVEVLKVHYTCIIISENDYVII